jgi:hypothetical protein
MTTTDQEGITYTLDIPAGALVGPQEISITPYGAIDDAPVGSSFKLGVDLQPEGLEFLETATLTITVPTGLPASADSSIVAFGAESDGDEFYFRSVSGTSSTEVTIPIRHFSGAGAMEASDSEVRQQQDNHPPTDVRDWAEQELLTDPTIEAEIAILRGVHAETLAVISGAAASPILMDQAFRQFRFWRIRFDTARGEVQARLAGLDAELLARFISAFELALVQARTSCQNHDLSQIGRLLRWSYLVLSYPDISAGLTDAQSIKEDAINCAKFELEFDSYIEAYTGESLDPIATAVTGTIPIGATVGAITGIALEGDGPLSYTQTSYFSTEECSTSFQGSDGQLRVLKVDLGLNLAAAGTLPTGPAGQPVLNLGVNIVGEGLSETVRMTCSGQVILDQQTTHWTGGWANLHLDESTSRGFEIRAWTPGNANDPVVGTKQYTGGNESFIEDTQLRLVHRPTL